VVFILFLYVNATIFFTLSQPEVSFEQFMEGRKVRPNETHQLLNYIDKPR